MFKLSRIKEMIPWADCMKDLNRGRCESRHSGAGSFSDISRMSSFETWKHESIHNSTA